MLRLLWIIYLCFDQIHQEYGIPNTIPTLPTYVGGKREEEKLSMFCEDIGNFSPLEECRGKGRLMVIEVPEPHVPKLALSQNGTL